MRGLNVRKWNYGNYSSENYGFHSMGFTDAQGNDFYFSYDTLVAFAPRFGRKVVIKNYWGNTTGKHLNWIDGGDKANRVDQETFDKLYNELIEQ